MVITVSARHMDVTPALKSFAEEKVGKLTKYYDRISEIEVVFNAQKVGVGVELLVHVEHSAPLVAQEADGDAYALLDLCMAKMERQLSEHKKKLRNRKHPES